MLKRILIRELTRRRQPFLSTLAMLVVSFSALLFSLALHESHQTLIALKAEEALTGSAQLSSTRPILTEEHDAIAKAPEFIKFSEEIEIFATLRHEQPATKKKSAALVEIKAVGDEFPLLGRVILDNQLPAKFSELSNNEIWVAQELQDKIGAKAGDTVAVGKKNLIIKNFIFADTGMNKGATGFAPRVYVKHSALTEAELILPGSQVQYKTTFLLANKEYSKVRDNLQPWPEDLIWRTPDDALGGLKRGLNQVETYLYLLTLFIALLGFVVGFYLLQLSLQKNTATYAIYILFGLPNKKLMWLVAFLTFSLALAAAGISYAIVYFSSQLINKPLSQALAYDLKITIGLEALLPFFTLVVLMGTIYALPYLRQIRQINLNGLLNTHDPLIPTSDLRSHTVTLSLTFFSFFLLVGLLLNMSKVVFGLAALTVPLLIAAHTLPPRLSRWLAERLQLIGAGRLVTLQLSRPRLTSSLLWLCLCITTIFVYTSVSSYRLLSTELKTPERRYLPQLFAINVSENEVGNITNKISSLGGEFKYLSPLILGRLLLKNGEPVEGRLARFPVRLTYREKLHDSEKIIAGEELAPRHSGGIAEVSLEAEFASRNGFTIGDTLDFEVAGLPLQAVVKNLREVQWNTFQPNFFMQFSPGVIDDFPKSFIGVVYGLGNDSVYQSQATLAESFPNVSWLNLSDTISRLADVADKLLVPISAVALGLVLAVVFLIAFLGWRLGVERREEKNLFTTLGLNKKQLLQLYWREHLLIYFSAIVVGLITSTAVIWWISVRLFSSAPDFHLADPAVILIAGVLLSFTTLVSLQRKST